ncbi:hypothetical protein HaLaN_30374 [Haematococcus lacustris]|uniref:Uncharacterized protein n=1 Tax=Haematococcus lacustris TaxID=44745 RepID=A0A6A0AEN2_HAELA|nr:hypothetical protein HaLaN_30374 [Haematococcus lacustris]
MAQIGTVMFIAAEDTGAHISVALLQPVAGVIFELCQLDVLRDVSFGDGLASQVAPRLGGLLGWVGCFSA